jgi:outer membrane protein assembly factor BamD
MKKLIIWTLFLGCFVLFSCKSTYEKVRTSNNPELILKNAFVYYEKEDYLKAQSLFELVMNSLRGRTDAEKAYYYYANCHFKLKEYTLAAYYFKNFSNTFTSSPLREEASYMSAFANYKLSPIYRLEQSNTVKAIEEFQVFVNLFPESKRVDECNKLIDECRRKLEEKAFGEGELYYNLRQYQSAVASFDNLLRDYPESPDVERVRFLIAKSYYLLSENSVIEKKEERYKSTIQRCDDFLEKYATGKYAKEIKQIKKDAVRSEKEVHTKLKNSKA